MAKEKILKFNSIEDFMRNRIGVFYFKYTTEKRSADYVLVRKDSVETSKLFELNLGESPTVYDGNVKAGNDKIQEIEERLIAVGVEEVKRLPKDLPWNLLLHEEKEMAEGSTTREIFETIETYYSIDELNALQDKAQQKDPPRQKAKLYNNEHKK